MENNTIKVLLDTDRVTKDGGFWQRIVEWNGRKFRYTVTVTDSSPLCTVGQDWYHSLCVMQTDGTWAQVADAKSVGAPYTHYGLVYRPVADIKFRIREIFNAFNDYIKIVY